MRSKRKSGYDEALGWIIRLENRIEAIRRKISYTYVLINCHKNQCYTKKQKRIKKIMEKEY